MSKDKKLNLPGDQSQREQVLNELDKTILVEAAAGTGKTTSMVGRMVGLIGHGKCRIETLAAVTFTRKAAGELRERLLAAVGPRAEAVSAMTFHAP